ncbi:GT4 family glycosyltransferase PelF [bacterium]|nr:GT4 family glycosyltransferase PelF [bacterium]
MTLVFQNSLTKKGKTKKPIINVPIADVCLLLEGTYPFVPGGVSSWVHSLIKGLPELRFSLFMILPDEKKKKLAYEIPSNVTGLYILQLSRKGYLENNRFSFFKNGKYLKEIFEFHRNLLNQLPEQQEPATGSSFLSSIDEIAHNTILQKEAVDTLAGFNSLSEIFSKQAWSIPTRIFSRNTWKTIKRLYNSRKLSCSFVDYFWTWRYLHSGIFAIMNAYVPKAKVYHTISTGYAGLLGARASQLHNSPLLLTEHGIYNKERKIDISRSPWIYEEKRHLFRAQKNLEVFKELWIKAFTTMSKICYASSDLIITLYTGNQKYQLQDGANPEIMRIIPNGIEFQKLSILKRIPQKRKIIGFVGRVVPIKDVKTFLRAVALVFKSFPGAEAWLMGPTDENKQYYEECAQLVDFLEIKDRVFFTGMVDLREYYPKLDVLVLTSISEAQPLVILEAYCLEIPVVATDVGSCRELIEGAPGKDAELGKSGLITGLTNPTETAMSILHLLRHPHESQKMGKIGKERVQKYYDMPKLIHRYRQLYKNYIEKSQL